MNSTSLAASVGLGILVFLLLLAIVGVVFLRKYLKTLNGVKPSRKLGTYIRPKEPPEFIIPPYTLISEGSDGGTATPVSENGENQADESTKRLSPPEVLRSLSMPAPLAPPGVRHGVIMAHSDQEGGVGVSQYRPQYRRAVSQFTPLSVQTKQELAKKVSVAPYGKLEVSIQFVTTKNLLFVQVCFYVILYVCLFTVFPLFSFFLTPSFQG